MFQSYLLSSLCIHGDAIVGCGLRQFRDECGCVAMCRSGKLYSPSLLQVVNKENVTLERNATVSGSSHVLGYPKVQLLSLKCLLHYGDWEHLSCSWSISTPSRQITVTTAEVVKRKLFSVFYIFSLLYPFIVWGVVLHPCHSEWRSEVN